MQPAADHHIRTIDQLVDDLYTAVEYLPGHDHVGTYNLNSDHDRAVYLAVVNRLGASNLFIAGADERPRFGPHLAVVHRRCGPATSTAVH